MRGQRRRARQVARGKLAMARQCHLEPLIDRERRFRRDHQRPDSILVDRLAQRLCHIEIRRGGRSQPKTGVECADAALMQVRKIAKPRHRQRHVSAREPRVRAVTGGNGRNLGCELVGVIIGRDEPVDCE